MTESASPPLSSVASDHDLGRKAFHDALYRRLADDVADAIRRVRLDISLDAVVVVAPPSLQDPESPGIRLDVGDRERDRINGGYGPRVWDYVVVNPGDSAEAIEHHIRRAACRARVAKKERS